MDYLFKKDMAFFHNNFAGSLTKKVNDYAYRYINLCDVLTFKIFTSYLPIIFAVIVLWTFSIWLVVGLVGLILITGYFVFPLIKRRQKLVAIRETAGNRTSGYVADMLGNIDAVKSFANEDIELHNHTHNVNDFAAKMKRTWDYQNLRIDMVTSPFYILTNAVGLIIALYLGTHSNINFAVIFIAFNYYATVTKVMWDFNQVYKEVESSVTNAAQFTDILLDKPAVRDISSSYSFNVTKGKIELRNISFRYDESDGEHLFKGMNLVVNPGEKIALVGHSGGGKTTITKLLLRYMDIEEGEILIDGQNIAHARQRDVRKNIAYVPQDPVMFHRSLEDNIRYGNVEASDEEVRHVAKLAYADEFIKELPQGYDTLVGERGIKLSGGQRQRIAIARAMIKNAPILLLDEATSALDSESEKYIQDALWKLMEGRTSIVIAHRLSTIQKMDRIIVLENGHVAQQGTHAELLKQGGIYANLWSHQSGGFIEE
jgi:ATP-binding cassette subfamily B protein